MAVFCQVVALTRVVAHPLPKGEGLCSLALWERAGVRVVLSHKKYIACRYLEDLLYVLIQLQVIFGAKSPSYVDFEAL
jgi:hypothetical protein